MKLQEHHIDFWKRVGWSFLPPLLLVLQNLDIWRSTPRTIFILVPLIFLVVIISITASLIKSEHGVSNLCLPPIGSLIWETNFVLFWFFNSPNRSLITGLLFVATTILIFAVYRLGIKIPSVTGWLMSGFLVTLMFICLLGSELPVNGFFFYAATIYNWLIKVAPVAAVGLLFTRNQQIDLSLLVAVIEPVWIGSYLIPYGIAFDILNSPAVLTQNMLLLFRVLPLIVFLILMPGSTLVVPAKLHKILIPIVSLVAISVLAYLRVTILHDTDLAFVFPTKLMWLFFVTLLWAPVLLATTFYYKANPHQKVQ